MIVDASAILAIILQEPGHAVLVRKLASASAVGIGAPTLVETGIVLTARVGSKARTLLARVVGETPLEVIPFGETHWSVALGAFERFGKGQHRAALNFGDCMAYAVAAVARQPLLCVGDDFARTDLELA